MTDLDRDIIQALRYQIMVQNQEAVKKDARIRELEDGSCRFNCRTAKQAFIAGYLADAQHGEHSMAGAERAYKEWAGD